MLAIPKHINIPDTVIINDLDIAERIGFIIIGHIIKRATRIHIMSNCKNIESFILLYFVSFILNKIQ